MFRVNSKWTLSWPVMAETYWGNCFWTTSPLPVGYPRQWQRGRGRWAHCILSKLLHRFTFANLLLSKASHRGEPKSSWKDAVGKWIKEWKQRKIRNWAVNTHSPWLTIFLNWRTEHMHACACSCMWMHLYRYIWRSEDKIKCHSSSRAIYIVFWSIVFHWLPD